MWKSNAHLRDRWHRLESLKRKVFRRARRTFSQRTEVPKALPAAMVVVASSSELTAELQARLESLKRKVFRRARRTFSQRTEVPKALPAAMVVVASSSELTAELQARLESLKRKVFRRARRTFSQWSLQIHWVVRADNKARFWQMLTESHSAYLWLIHPIKNRSTPFALLWMPIMNGRACFHSSLSCPKHRLRRYLLCSMSNQAALKNLRVVVSPRILWK